MRFSITFKFTFFCIFKYFVKRETRDIEKSTNSTHTIEEMNTLEDQIETDLKDEDDIGVSLDCVSDNMTSTIGQAEESPPRRVKTNPKGRQSH